MSHTLAKGIGILIFLQLSFQHIFAQCDDTYQSYPHDCVGAYETAMSGSVTADNRDAVITFRDDTNSLPNDKKVYWYTHWNDMKVNSESFVDYCKAVKPIDSQLSTLQCLCELQDSCDDICDNDISDIFIDETNNFISQIGRGEIENEQQKCQTALTQIQSKGYDTLCDDNPDVLAITNCANGGSTPSPDQQPTPKPTKKVTPAPTTPNPTSTLAPIDTEQGGNTDTPVDTTASPESTTSSPPAVTVPSVNTTIPDTTPQGQGANKTDATTNTPSLTTNDTATPSPVVDDIDKLMAINTTYYPSWEGDSIEPTPRPTPDINETLDTEEPDTTNPQGQLIMDQQQSHPVANLVLVALIIIGFCVFVAWYAKKNQIATDGGKGDEDNGYLWGLNQQSSPSQEQRMDERGDGRDRRERRHKRGRDRDHRHKPLSQFDEDQLDQQMNIQMTMTNNNDLLAITPDHVGRLQTRAPNQMAPNAPNQTKRNRKRDRKTRRRGKGAAFEQVKDDEDPFPDDDDVSESDDSESGEDMMKMSSRDQYYASQTFGKKLADTLGDIKDTGTAIAQAVQSKLMKKEATVVRPMQMGSRPGSTKSSGDKKSKKSKKERRPFTMVDDNETTEDGFDLSDSSNSTKEDEYREDPETEVRMNIHGRKIKQPMKLPTFDDDEDEEVDLTQTHNDDNMRKSKKKRKKDKKKKKKKEKKEKKLQQQQQQSPQFQEMPQSQPQSQSVPDEIAKEVLEVSTDKVEVKNESHDINITINNDDNMGFGTDELEEDQHDDLNVNELTKQTKETKLSQEEQDMYLKELENSLMGGNNDMDITQSVDLSAFDATTNELSNGNGVVGNGNGVIPHEN